MCNLYNVTTNQQVIREAVATGPPQLHYEVVGVDHPEVLQPEKVSLSVDGLKNGS